MANTVKAASWPVSFQVAFTLTGAPALIKWETIASGQTILKGDPVTKASDEISLGATGSGTLYGIAMANGVAAGVIPVAVADRNTVFIGQADAKTEDIYDGAVCDIVGGTGAWTVNIGTVTESVLLIVGHVVGDSKTDNTDPGRLHFVIARSSWDALVAAL